MSFLSKKNLPPEQGMMGGRESSQKLIRNYHKKVIGTWIAVLLALTLLAGGEFVLLHNQRDVLHAEADIISLSSRQEILLQRIALLGQQIILTIVPEEQETFRTELRHEVENLQELHKGLWEKLQTPRYLGPFSKTPPDYFQEPVPLNTYLLQIISETKALIETPNAQLHKNDPHLRRILSIVQSKTISKALEKVTQLHHENVLRELKILGGINNLILVLRLTLFFFLTVFMVQPLLKRITWQVGQLAERNEKLIQRAQELDDARHAALNIMEDAELARRQAEASKEAVYRLASIVESSSDAILGKTLDGTITDWNKAAEKLYGYSPEEIVGTSVLQLFPEDRKQELAQILERIGRGEKIMTYETARVRKDGKRIDVAISISPIFDEHRRIIGASSISRDITQRKKMEALILESKEKFETFMTNSPVMAFMKDQNGKYTYVNRPLEQIFKVSAHHLIGKSDFDWFPEEIAKEIATHDEAVFRSGATQEFIEQIPMPDGVTRYWLVYRFLVGDAQNSASLGGVGIDITDRLQAERQLKIYSEKLRQSNEDLEHFAHIVAHDLQEPVNKIIGFSNLVMEKDHTKLDKETQDYLKRLQKASERMGQLVRSLLSYSRITSKKEEFKKTDLNKILEDVLSDIDAKIQDKKAKIEVEALPVVDGDPVQLRQLFQNLILNAVKFSRKEETPNVRISSKMKNRGCEILIADNGIGFEPQYAGKIFMPFKRLHGANTYEGIGMGLAICKKIVARHGGEIVAESQTGIGTTFRVYLPQ